jgi:SsrA-binding protein
MAKQQAKQGEHNIAINRRALRDYDVEDRYEAGIVLTGTEVKSLRAGHINFKDSYAAIKGSEIWLYSAHIDEYAEGNRYNHDPERPRKLLLHRREINHLANASQRQGYTLIPLRMYFKEQKVKVELGLCRGKRQYDQRQDIAEREAKRQIERAMRRRE